MTPSGSMSQKKESRRFEGDHFSKPVMNLVDKLKNNPMGTTFEIERRFFLYIFLNFVADKLVNLAGD